jgi:hypothetical protein
MTVVRACLGCEQSDDHPKHVMALRDGSDAPWHMDCHAKTGCESCRAQTANQGDARGEAFRAILIRGA